MPYGAYISFAFNNIKITWNRDFNISQAFSLSYFIPRDYCYWKKQQVSVLASACAKIRLGLRLQLELGLKLGLGLELD